jgi:hypothetical protein
MAKRHRWLAQSRFTTYAQFAHHFHSCVQRIRK